MPEVEAPDWNPQAFCGGGLHCLPNAIGNWNLLDGHYWVVLEFDEKNKVQIDTGKCKARKCKIVFLSKNPEGLLQFFDHEKFNSETAYWWATKIGNKDIMIDRITESKWAYYWAYFFGNKDIMISKVVESDWAYMWALYIGDEDIMIDRITDKDIMVGKIPKNY